MRRCERSAGAEYGARPVRRLGIVMLVVAAFAVGCGDDEEPAAEDTIPDATLLEGDRVDIDAVDNSFQPEAARIAAGTEVTWTNQGQNTHNIIPVDDGDDFGADDADFEPGDTVSSTFDEPGVYRYYCSIHGTATAGMPGVIVVE